MYVDEHFVNPARIGVLSESRERRTSLLAQTPEAKRPARFRVRARKRVEGRDFGPAANMAGTARYLSRILRRTEGRRSSGILRGRRFTSGIPMRGVVPRILGGRDFSPAEKTRAGARHQSRCLTRAKFSPFTAHYSPITNHASLFTNHRPSFTNRNSRVTNHATGGGTVNRPRTHVSCRKQTTGHMQGRNFPVHFLFPFSARFLSRILRTGRPFLPGVPETLCVLGWLAGVPETLRVLGWLPETVTRVEPHLSHRKQTTAHASTRNVPAHGYFRVLFARVHAFARRAASATRKKQIPRRPEGGLCRDDIDQKAARNASHERQRRQTGVWRSQAKRRRAASATRRKQIPRRPQGGLCRDDNRQSGLRRASGPDSG